MVYFPEALLSCPHVVPVQRDEVGHQDTATKPHFVNGDSARAFASSLNKAWTAFLGNQRPEAVVQDCVETTAASPVNSKEKSLGFVREALRRIQNHNDEEYYFVRWAIAGSPTQAGVGRVDVRGKGVSVDSLVRNLFDFEACPQHMTSVKDSWGLPRLSLDASEHPFYQRIHIPVLGYIHYALSMVDAGRLNVGGHNYRVLYWYQLNDQTQALSPEKGGRTAVNMGGWLIEEDPECPGQAASVSYALHSCPIRNDVNAGQWLGLTVGADATISTVVKKNIDMMVDWAKPAENSQ